MISMYLHRRRFCSEMSVLSSIRPWTVFRNKWMFLLTRFHIKSVAYYIITISVIVCLPVMRARFVSHEWALFHVRRASNSIYGNRISASMQRQIGARVFAPNCICAKTVKKTNWMREHETWLAWFFERRETERERNEHSGAKCIFSL